MQLGKEKIKCLVPGDGEPPTMRYIEAEWTNAGQEIIGY